MRNSQSGSSLITFREIEERWSFADAERITEAEFSRSRRRARIRALGAIFRKTSLGPCSAPSADGSFSMPLLGIGGLVLRGGGLSRGLPPLRRSSLRAWNAAYARFATEAYEAFPVRCWRGAWYLEGGDEALLRLEILRARGEEAVLVRPIRAERRAPSPAPACCAAAS